MIKEEHCVDEKSREYPRSFHGTYRKSVINDHVDEKSREIPINLNRWMWQAVGSEGQEHKRKVVISKSTEN